MDTLTLLTDKKKSFTTRGREEKVHTFIFWLLILGLLILRFPIFSWMELYIRSSRVWVTPVYEIGTYLLVAMLIWWERERLGDYHIDTLSIWMIILFRPIASIILNAYGLSTDALAFPQWLSLPFFLIGFVLVFTVIRKKIKIEKVTKSQIRWLAFGGFFGIILSIVFSILMIGWMDYPIPPFPDYIAILAPFYQLGYAAVPEEPLFRGFLWGGLRSLGIKSIWVLVIQAVLFTVGHIHLLNFPHPFLNLSIVFVFSIVAGIFVWRSRSLASSMAFHGFWNGSSLFIYWTVSTIFK